MPTKTPDKLIVPALGCLSREPRITSVLRDLTPYELGKAASGIRAFLTSLQFQEVLLNPLSIYPIDYLDEVIDIAGIGQLRFNTEPEIWSAGQSAERFYSISSLFRKETTVNPLRRLSFFAVEFYQHGTPDSLLPVFRGVLAELAKGDFSRKLNELHFDNANYDSVTDSPKLSRFDTRWVVTSGYDPENSFYEVDEDGRSTRREVFLITPVGYLEVGVFGITGWNQNPAYIGRSGQTATIRPDFGRSGMCFGLERLLLAERILNIIK